MMIGDAPRQAPTRAAQEGRRSDGSRLSSSSDLGAAREVLGERSTSDPGRWRSGRSPSSASCSPCHLLAELVDLLEVRLAERPRVHEQLRVSSSPRSASSARTGTSARTRRATWKTITSWRLWLKWCRLLRIRSGPSKRSRDQDDQAPPLDPLRELVEDDAQVGLVRASRRNERPRIVRRWPIELDVRDEGPDLLVERQTSPPSPAGAGSGRPARPRAGWPISSLLTSRRRVTP